MKSQTSIVAAIFCLSSVACAEDAFRDRVVPILQTRCLSCHNELDRKGEFSLQTITALRESGFVEPGRPDDSHLLNVLIAADGEPASMPKDAEPLTDDEVNSLRTWIADGAQWPESFELTEPAVDDFDWWSFKSLTRPPVPTFEDGSDEAAWIRSPIDAFILEKLREHDLHPSPEADRRTFIRRLSFDLTGLPPEASLLSEQADSSITDIVEKMLASPHYGERWARHWLDVVKYADTCGYDKDKLRANAWPYRDYVIRSFNEDKPYARFVQEQIAGDILFPGEPDGILGLGFIAAGPWDFIGHVEVPESKIDGMVARNLDRDDMVSNTLNTFCSVTIQCARCHNHKFDPFTQEHYYGLQSVFAAVDRAERPYDIDPQVEQQRNELTASRSELDAALKKFDAERRKEGGPELAALTAKISELKPRAIVSDKRPEFGYHSQIAATSDAEKWVEVDLGRDVAISKIVLHASHDDFNGVGAGFGFPRRFRVDARTSADHTMTVADFTDAAFANPGLQPVELPTDSVTARFVRITATQLAERQNDFILALAEAEVFDETGTNAAAAAAVNALDSIEAPDRWRKSNLTDGIWPRAADPDIAAELADAEQRKTEILAHVLTPDRVAERKSLQARRDAIDEQLKALPTGSMVYAAATHFSPQGNFKPTNGNPRLVTVLHRGNVQQPGEPARPGTIPLSENDAWQFELSDEHSEADSRAEIARWITRDDNPLTWRSIANRIWQYHFGQGLVDSPNDFGRMGQQPTHPELLDWLAAEFRQTQSFKHMHRLIVSSATYRQTSSVVPSPVAGERTRVKDDATAIDGDNRFLWRMNRRRLSAEEIRDSVLSVSGKLNTEIGGPGFYLFELEKTDHSPHYEYHKFDPADPASHRRSIYRFIVRSQPDPLMTTLDCADSSQSTPKRTETLTSLQALSLLNNRFVLTMSEAFAERVQQRSGTTAEKVASAFEHATGRQPTADEAETLNRYADEHGLANLCRVLFNLSEFVFVD